MQYDPIKKSLGKVFNSTPVLRKLFYHLLDTLLLRTWHIHREIRKWASNNAGPREILDAGSGFGQYSYFLSGYDRQWKIKGVDVKQEQIDDCNGFFARAGRTNARFEPADLTTFTEPNHYDLILSVDVMEHIEEDVKVFENFYASLKPGGMVLISTPSDKGGSDVHDHGEGSFIEEHVRDGYNIDEIQEKLRKAGFSATEARYQYGCPGKIAWRLSMKYPILMLGFSKLLFVILPFYYLLVMPFCLILNYADTRIQHSEGTGLIVRAMK
ncbi:MAG: class I SAM-dependent methyltransferase [Lentimicrobiaceae bacterium]|nr:class I SAM-dependent methyltransferase [Lentimicrobiaceae bacterium]